MNADKLREILAEELDKAGAGRNARAVRDNDWAGATGITAALAAMRRVDDAAFIRWLDKLKDELRSTYGYTPPQVEQYVTAQPEAWREFFNDDYTPADAAAEDQRAGVE